MSNNTPIIIISDVLEYLFCPRFIYFIHCLDIPQHEGRRYKVLRGREVHSYKKKTNPHYLRKKLGVIKREHDVFMASRNLQVKGIVDEVIFLKDGTAAPFEYKFAEYKEKIFNTYRYQLVLQALLIQENFDIPVNRGYICFVRSNDHIEEVVFSRSDFEKGKEVIQSILTIIETGFFPKGTKNVARCSDCCYRNICV